MTVDLGAICLIGGACRFRVWAPRVRKMEVHLVQPRDRVETLEPQDRGYHEGVLVDVGPGARYLYRLDDVRERPDPASRFQPLGVHGPSQVVDLASHAWTDSHWRGIVQAQLVFYEMHVGTFTPEGTLDAAIPRLDDLARLGVTAIQLMPLAQFPGTRNWGYDGTYPYAVSACYGGPAAMQRFVDACHARRLAVSVDVVYNHLGPEGNYLGDFGPYFSTRCRTPWGDAVNFDGPGSDEVRHYFIQNALFWVTDLHADVLRLDAIHGIFDFSARPFLAELGSAVRQRGQELRRRVFVIAESDLNDSRVIRPPSKGGLGLDAQWSDDFHHSVHTLLTAERDGYYVDFGRTGDLVKVLEQGYVYTGQHSQRRNRRHGNATHGLTPQRFVVATQTHDQVGNRALGERLSHLVSFEAQKLATGILLLSPFIPLLFMGQEYGETSPFLYFTDHGDADLIEAVRRGRRAEFEELAGKPEIPDPQSPESFTLSKLHWGQRQAGAHRALWALCRGLLSLRRAHPLLRRCEAGSVRAGCSKTERVVWMSRGGEAGLLAVFNFESHAVELDPPEGWHGGEVLVDSASGEWEGTGSRLGVGTRLAAGAGIILAGESFVLLG